MSNTYYTYNTSVTRILSSVILHHCTWPTSGQVRGYYKSILVFHCSGWFDPSTGVILGADWTISIMSVRCCRCFLASRSQRYFCGAALDPRSGAGLLQVDSGVSLQWMVCSINIGHFGSRLNHFYHAS